MTKEEVIAKINELAATLGRVPSFPQLKRLTTVGAYDIRSNFGTWTRALRACGLQREGAGYQLGAKTLFLDWAGLVRKLGKIPTVADYELRAPVQQPATAEALGCVDQCAKWHAGVHEERAFGR